MKRVPTLLRQFIVGAYTLMIVKDYINRSFRFLTMGLQRSAFSIVNAVKYFLSGGSKWIK